MVETAEEEKALDAQEVAPSETTPQEPTDEEKPEDLKAQLEEAKGRLKALEAAQQEAAQLKEALKQRDRKIFNMTRQPQDKAEIEAIRAEIAGLAAVVLSDEPVDETRPLSKRELYERAVQAKKTPPREASGPERAYALKMSQLLKKHGIETDTPPEDMTEVFTEANSYWGEGAYGLALDTMREALQDRAQKQSKAETEEKVAMREEEEKKRKEGREKLATNLTRDNSPGGGGPPPNMKSLLERPVHNMTPTEMAEYKKAIETVITKK